MGFNPQPYDGTRYLAQGFAGLGQGLGQGLQQLGDQMAKRKEEQKNLNATAGGLRKVFEKNPELMGLAGLDEESLKGMGSEGVVSSFAAAMKAQTLKGLAQEQEARQQQMEQQRADMEMARRSAAASGAALNRFSSGPPALSALASSRSEGSPFGLSDYAPQLTAPANDMERLRHAASTPGLDIRGLQALSSLARNMSQMQEGDGNGPMQFEEDPVSGTRFGRSGNTTLPSGVNPAKAGKDAIPQYDEEGQLLGHSIPNGRGAFIFKSITKPAGVRAEWDPVMGTMKFVGDPDQVEEFVNKRKGGGGGPAPSKTGKALDKETAAKLLQEAGGDKDKARALARERGYTF